MEGESYVRNGEDWRNEEERERERGSGEKEVARRRITLAG